MGVGAGEGRLGCGLDLRASSLRQLRSLDTVVLDARLVLGLGEEAVEFLGVGIVECRLGGLLDPSSAGLADAGDGDAVVRGRCLVLAGGQEGVDFGRGALEGVGSRCADDLVSAYPRMCSRRYR